MRFYLFNLACIAGSIVLLFAAFKALTGPSVFVTGSQDFGTAIEGTTVHRVLRLINNSTRPITITKVEASCTCTSAGISEGTIVLPKSSRAFEVALNTSWRNGKVEVPIAIEYLGGKNPIMIDARVEVFRPYILTCPDNCNFSAAKGEPVELRWTWKWDQDSSDKVSAVKSLSGNSKLQLKWDKELKSYLILVRPETTTPTKVWRDRIRVYTSLNAMPFRDIDISGVITGSIRIVPEEVICNLNQETLRDGFVINVRSLRERFKISGTSFSSEELGLRERVSKVNDWSYNIVVSGDIDKSKVNSRKIYEDFLYVTTNLANEEHLKIPILGYCN